MSVLGDVVNRSEHPLVDPKVAEAAAANPNPTPRSYNLPVFWGWLSPVFSVTASWIIAFQAYSSIPWLPYLMCLGFGVRLLMFPFMIKQMTLINKMAGASPHFRLLGKIFKHVDMRITKKARIALLASYAFAKSTGTNLMKFYLYNLLQLPVFIIMVRSIRKLSFENDDLAGKGIFWFKDLNEPDPYMILPLLACLLNYINLGRGITKENEHWFINRFRSFFQVLQFFHLPFTHKWPAGAFIYWISSSLFVFVQATLLKRPAIMSYINPNFFFNYAKMYG